ncbi:ubiquinol-cytochrome c reductase iron-sulfur subunit [Rhodopila globiformis]|uniref:Ubiquinol-cytochrome c reductase iron-sulfur subunit n=1 Tax=Rhodopila globiformis TaxID=1071 RepID=A0A2S6NEE0_RHOGL|nr:ubiquinol-cytochrome c reductase iron-sulfur subunit [Rhodopila globiformis]PPQ32973.1 ubiquinol-cytochrome c reductase iron-sulfur subunit [Rhodopila globiformis]
MSASVTIEQHTAGPVQDGSRRDFLTLITTVGAAIGAGAVAWPFINSMDPARDTLAAGVPIDVDLGKIQEGQQIIALWRGSPIFVLRRSKQALARLQDPTLTGRLRDPQSSVHQQPAYAENWHRSVRQEFAVLVGICTHLGCVPTLYSKPDATVPVENWPGGYFCHCHGSKYDLAGRVHAGVPAPYNPPVPRYVFTNDTTVQIGENPPGDDFALNSVVQM